jgi:GT2 family glycosyltransferase
MQFIDYLPGRRAGATDHLAGCNLALRRCDFLDHGGFREDLIVGEDSLFIEDAARRWGKLVRFVPQMAVDHRGRRALAAFWHHQLRFGYHRALLGSRLKPALRRHGRSLLGTGYFCLRRFCYFFLRLAQWDPLGLPRFLLLVPMTAFGLAGYGKGFRKGCREAEARADE